MANIKTPDGGFYVDDSQFDVDYQKNVVSLAGGVAGDYLPLAGGTMAGAIAMGSQKITGLADATDPGDALNKNVGDATYALKTAIPTNATTATAGIVKQATAIEDSSGATDTALETKFNALLAALRTAGVLASS